MRNRRGSTWTTLAIFCSRAKVSGAGTKSYGLSIRCARPVDFSPKLDRFSLGWWKATKHEKKWTLIKTRTTRPALRSASGAAPGTHPRRRRHLDRHHSHRHWDYPVLHLRNIKPIESVPFGASIYPEKRGIRKKKEKHTKPTSSFIQHYGVLERSWFYRIIRLRDITLYVVCIYYFTR